MDRLDGNEGGGVSDGAHVAGKVLLYGAAVNGENVQRIGGARPVDERVRDVLGQIQQRVHLHHAPHFDRESELNVQPSSNRAQIPINPDLAGVRIAQCSGDHTRKSKHQRRWSSRSLQRGHLSASSGVVVPPPFQYEQTSLWSVLVEWRSVRTASACGRLAPPWSSTGGLWAAAARTQT
jgi:hypothetical protein